MKIFFQILFAWQENDLGFWICLRKNGEKHTKKPHPKQPIFPTHNQHHLKFWHDKGSISGPPGKGTQIFYETKQLV